MGDLIKSGGDAVFDESVTDASSTWASMSAYTECEYCMLYWTGSQWDTPVDVYAYMTADSGGFAAPPTNLGVEWSCTDTNEPWNEIGSDFGGPWSEGQPPGEPCS